MPTGLVYNKKTLSITLAIVTILIFLVGYIVLQNQNTVADYSAELSTNKQLERALVAATTSDFVYGDIEAPNKIVLYSDIDCRYCRALFPKLMSIVDQASSSVALIYRPFPLFDQQSVIGEEEVMLFCVQKLKDNNAVFTFLTNAVRELPANTTFSTTPRQALLNAAFMAGVSNSELEDCITESLPELTARIERMRNDGRALKVRSLPHTFVLSDTAMLNFVGDRPTDFYQRVLSEM